MYDRIKKVNKNAILQGALCCLQSVSLTTHHRRGQRTEEDRHLTQRREDQPERIEQYIFDIWRGGNCTVYL